VLVEQAAELARLFAASRSCSPRVARCLRWALASSMCHCRPLRWRRAPQRRDLYSSKQSDDIALKEHVANVYFKCFQMFQRCVTSVSHRCCKSRSGCCICCNDDTRMLQVCVLNVSFVYQKHIISVFILGVAISTLHMFCNGFSSVLSDVFSNVLDTCFKCFICL
jgi:hypothetical protein